ncbi:hypothetical protein Moror_160 [Moniliophthora roreri MCA 2997]|uniref:Uncharacterized protein n=2 Tax=Moniliophthora roreri TaxID=221103 RepID=V2Y0X1_MONRO|nr:hypothetical protein Moror_160 [Moniliophthora roreri MCA 2997]
MIHSDTAIIIAVCASVGFVIVLISLRLLYRRLVRAKPAPLPPIQPLAHHRETHVSRLSLSPYKATAASHVSLVSKDRLTPTADNSLPLPIPSFHTHDSSLSLTSSDEPSSPETPPPPTLSSFSTQSHASIATTTYHESRHSPNRPRSRPDSYTSMASTTRTSHSIRRGLPHDPQNQLQIVLPAPLASSFSPYAAPAANSSRLSVHTPGMPQRRLSFADGWAPKAIRSERSYQRERARSSSESLTSKRNALKRPHSSLRMSSTPSTSDLGNQSRPSTPHTAQSLSADSGVPPLPNMPNMSFNIN